MLELHKVKIPDMMGTSKVELDGQFNETSLSESLINEWVPYIDCDRKCSRSDYCPFTIISKYNKERHVDIRCGVMTKFIQNFIKKTFDILQNIDQSNLTSYFDGLFNLSKFVLNAETAIASCVSDSAMEWWGEQAYYIFSYLTQLRENLNRSCTAFYSITQLNTVKGVLFVEGLSEKILLEKLRESNMLWFSHLNVISYGGASNSRPGRIQMLLDDYVNRGYQIYLQGDNDGSATDKYQDLRTKCKISKENIFCFEYDFESSIPPGILFEILKSIYEKFDSVIFEDFRNQLSPRIHKRSVIRSLQEKYAIDITNQKIDIAIMLGEILNNPQFIWHQDKTFMESELGKFIEFIIKIK